MRKVLPVQERLKLIPFPDPNLQGGEQPVEITYYLPEYVYTTEDSTSVKMAVWDESTKSWNIKMIGGECEFKPASRQISFTTTTFAPIAMLQSRCTDYPYKDWKLRCVEDEKAYLTLETKRMELMFEIGPLYVKLIRNTAPSLKHLADKPMHPGYLLQELSKCGVHLMPRDEDAKLAGINLKYRPAEERAIVDVATSVRAFHFKRCTWNHGSPDEPGLPEDMILLSIRENLEYDEFFLEDHEPDWRYVAWWHNKCAFVNGCREIDKTIQSTEDKPLVANIGTVSGTNVRVAEGHETHALLNIAVQPPVCSETAAITSQDLSPIDFINTVKKTLRLLRLFSFS